MSDLSPPTLQPLNPNASGVALEPPYATDGDVALATFAKALGHPTRVKIMRFLLEQESCMCGEICERLPLAQSTVSQHLKVLKEAGLIVGAIDGPAVCYSPNRATLEAFKQLVNGL